MPFEHCTGLLLDWAEIRNLEEHVCWKSLGPNDALNKKRGEKGRWRHGATEDTANRTRGRKTRGQTEEQKITRGPLIFFGPGFGAYISGFRFPVSRFGFRFQVLGFMFSVPWLLFLLRRFLHLLIL